MLLVLPLAVACGNDEKPPVTTGDSTDPADGSDPAVTDPNGTDSTPAGRAHKVPVDTLDFGNEKFNIIAWEWQGYPYYFHSEESSSDPMQAALYNRVVEIEDELGVDITYYMYRTEREVNELIKTDVMNGSTEMDIALLHCIDGLTELTANAYLYPLEELGHVDLEADWWNLEQMDTLRAGKHYYLGVNDYMIPCPYVIFFNKKMVEDLGMEDPYQLVLDQKWTYDTFTEMARAATKDVNTDGAFTLGHDTFGIACDDPSNYVSFITAIGQDITKKGDDGRLKLAMNTEKMAGLVADFAALATDNVFYPDWRTEPNQITMDSDQLLFFLAPITSAETLRDCEVPFGILPYPKYDEAQEDYRTLDWGGLMAVPSIIDNADKTGAVIELLAFKAEEEVIPAYYDLVLDGQLAQDPTTPKMLDVIFDTICYEPGMNYWGQSGSFLELFYVLSHQAIDYKNANFASFYATHADSAQQLIDTYYVTLELYEE